VGKVTVSASWNCTRFLFPELSFDDFDMYLFNPGVAFGAGRSDVSS
jgi:hypothetical protein